MISKVINTIKVFNLIEKGDKVLVGVSGGADSICLLHILKNLSDNLSFEIVAVHINHKLRGDESDDDEKYVHKICALLDIPLFSRSFDILSLSKEKKMSIEEIAREVRYSEFYSISNEVNASKIAVAHNKNDQAETVLMNIIRGTALDGLKGIEFKRNNIIRPLLNIDRSDIEDYCLKNSLAPRTDSSNLKSIYTRNRIRIDLIPYINELFNTNIIDNIYKMSNILKVENEYMEISTNDIYKHLSKKSLSGEIIIDPLKFNLQHDAIKKRPLRTAIKEIKGNLKGIENIHIENISILISQKKTGSRINLPSGIKAIISYDSLIITNINTTDNLSFCKILNISGSTFIDNIGIIHSNMEKKSKDIEHYTKSMYNSLVQFFDYDSFYEYIKENFKESLCFRNRLNGDIFKPYKSNGTKKLKEYFIDSKIPRDLRNQIPLIALGSEILWIIGYKVSDKFKVTENTKNILILKYENILK